MIQVVLLAEIFSGCCGLLLNGERQFETYAKSTVTTFNTYLQSLLSHHQCRGYVQIYIYIYIYMFKILRQTIVEQSEVEIITLMEVKTQEQVLKLFSACVVIISIQRNEQNRTWFPSMLSSLQDPIGSGPEEWVFGAFPDYSLDYSIE